MLHSPETVKKHRHTATGSVLVTWYNTPLELNSDEISWFLSTRHYCLRRTPCLLSSFPMPVSHNSLFQMTASLQATKHSFVLPWDTSLKRIVGVHFSQQVLLGPGCGDRRGCTFQKLCIPYVQFIQLNFDRTNAYLSTAQSLLRLNQTYPTYVLHSATRYRPQTVAWCRMPERVGR